MKNIFEDFNSTLNELENLEQLLEIASNENDSAVIKDCKKKINLLVNQIKKTQKFHASCLEKMIILDTYLGDTCWCWWNRKSRLGSNVKKNVFQMDRKEKM